MIQFDRIHRNSNKLSNVRLGKTLRRLSEFVFPTPILSHTHISFTDEVVRTDPQIGLETALLVVAQRGSYINVCPSRKN